MLNVLGTVCLNIELRFIWWAVLEMKPLYNVIVESC